MDAKAEQNVRLSDPVAYTVVPQSPIKLKPKTKGQQRDRPQD